MKGFILTLLALTLSASLWASQSFNGTDQSLRGGGLITGNRPVSVAFWMQLNTITGLPIFWVTANAGGTASAYVFINNTVSNAVILVDGNRNVTSSNTVSTGAMIHVVAVFNSDSSRIIYVNGTATTGAADTLTFDFNGATQTSIGAYYVGGVTSSFTNGYLSDFAFYNVALTAADVASLLAGASPIRVRPSALVNYFPLTGTLNALNNSGALTNINTSPVSNVGPRIYR